MQGSANFTTRVVVKPCVSTTLKVYTILWAAYVILRVFECVG